MALYGILGDIHGNKEAFLASLDFLSGKRAETLLCTGDIVGYNAEPDECVGIARALRVTSIAGNHDLIATRQLDPDQCCDKAAYALRRTRSKISTDSARFLAALPRIEIFEGQFVLVHGGVNNPQEYLWTSNEVLANFAPLKKRLPGARICFFGHTHEQRVFELDGENIREVQGRGQILLRKDRVYFINPGSVDASRKRRPGLAECATFDSDRRVLELHQVPYNHELSEANSKYQGYRMDAFTAALYSFSRRIRQRGRRVLSSLGKAKS